MLGGGLPRSGTFLLVGAPGAGKTTLALQTTFHTARTEGPVLFLTTLSESHTKLLTHARSFAFFDADRIGTGLELLNLQSLIEASPGQTIQSIVSTARRSRASLVVVEDLNSLQGVLGSDYAGGQFLYELGSELALLGVTLLASFQTDPREPTGYPQLAVADGVLALWRERRGAGHSRYVEVLKLRGLPHLDGLHTIGISAAGIACYPQLESLPTEPIQAYGSGRVAFDLPELDAMLGGGLNQGSMTLLAGSSGSGKTLAALHFILSGAARGEAGLFVSFRESASQLWSKATGFGLDLEAAATVGTVQIMPYPIFRLDPDVVAHEVLACVERTGARRLVIDSMRELERALEPARLGGYPAALVSFLHAREVTTLFTYDLPAAAGPGALPEIFSAVVDNIIVFRQVEHRAEARRLASVHKMRCSTHDSRPREFVIGDRGISVLDRFDSAEEILSGVGGFSGASG